MSDILNITDAQFQAEVLDSTLPVVVDFWAPWCGPCRMIAPTLEKLAGEFDGKVRFVKVNVDENQQYAAQFGVQGIPNLVIFRGGEKVQQIVGALPEPALREQIETALGVTA